MHDNWQQEDWSDFDYELDGFQDLLFRFTEKAGRADGLLAALPESLQTETIIALMASEAIKSSEIEGDLLSRPDVMSSIMNNLGLHLEPKQVSPHISRLRAAEHAPSPAYGLFAGTKYSRGTPYPANSPYAGLGTH